MDYNDHKIAYKAISKFLDNLIRKIRDKYNVKKLNILLMECSNINIIKLLYKKKVYNITLIYKNNDVYIKMKDDMSNYNNKLLMDNKRTIKYNIYNSNINIVDADKYDIILSYNFNEFFKSYVEFDNLVKFLNRVLKMNRYFIGVGIENNMIYEHLMNDSRIKYDDYILTPNIDFVDGDIYGNELLVFNRVTNKNDKIYGIDLSKANKELEQLIVIGRLSFRDILKTDKIGLYYDINVIFLFEQII